MKTNTNNIETATDAETKTLRPRFRSGLLPRTQEEEEEEVLPGAEVSESEPDYGYKSVNSFALMTRAVKPALMGWTAIAGLYFAGSIFCFQPATALSDGYKPFIDQGKPELKVAFEYNATGGHFKGDETVIDNSENRQKFAPVAKVGIFYNPINGRDYETDRNDKFAMAITPAWVLFAWTAAPFLAFKNESTPLVLPRRRRQTEGPSTELCKQ